MIEVRIEEDSVGPNGVRLTTFVLTYPRFIHSEVMTHRVFSRNASSSRAIPVKKQIANVRKNMAIPIHIGANQKGMQAAEEVSALKKKLALVIWKGLGHTACLAASLLDKIGVHKQVANRIIEPWTHISVVLSGTDFDNFFALRYHKDAQPEFYELAKKMYEAYVSSTPKRLRAGEWHLPFIREEDRHEASYASRRDHGDLRDVVPILVKMSAARCARVSYLTHDNRKPSIKEDMDLYDRLASHKPMHASPLEHQACATEDRNFRSGNFVGWIQHRKTIPGENVQVFKRP